MKTLTTLNAAKAVNGWTWLSGYLSGLADTKAYFKLKNVKIGDAWDDHGEWWFGEFTCDGYTWHDFRVCTGNPEKDAVLANWTSDKIYQLTKGNIPRIYWDDYMPVEIIGKVLD